MKIYTEQALSDVQWWNGARDTAEHLDDADFETLETELEQLYPDGINETELNDLFWFDQDWIAETLGYTDFEQLITERSNE